MNEVKSSKIFKIQKTLPVLMKRPGGGALERHTWVKFYLRKMIHNRTYSTINEPTGLVTTSRKNFKHYKLLVCKCKCIKTT